MSEMQFTDCPMVIAVGSTEGEEYGDITLVLGDMHYYLTKQAADLLYHLLAVAIDKADGTLDRRL